MTKKSRRHVCTCQRDGCELCLGVRRGGKHLCGVWLHHHASPLKTHNYWRFTATKTLQQLIKDSKQSRLRETATVGRKKDKESDVWIQKSLPNYSFWIHPLAWKCCNYSYDLHFRLIFLFHGRRITSCSLCRGAIPHSRHAQRDNDM